MDGTIRKVLSGAWRRARTGAVTGAAAALLGALVAPALASAETLVMATGAADGPGQAIGKDIAELARLEGIALQLRESAGPVETAMAVRFTPGVQLGIVPADLADYLTKRARRPEVAARDVEELLSSIEVVMPLHVEAVHLLGRNGLYTLADLEGKTVSIGPADSATAMTAATILDIAGVSPGRIETLAAAEALAALKAGRIDAMFLVAQQPSPLLRDEVGVDDGISMVEIFDTRLEEGNYLPVTISRDAYPWLAMNTASVGVRTALVAYGYRGAHCTTIGRLAEAVSAGLDTLRARGDPRWGDIDPLAGSGSWAGHQCVEKALARTGAAPEAEATDAAGTGGAEADAADGAAGDQIDDLLGDIVE